MSTRKDVIPGYKVCLRNSIFATFAALFSWGISVLLIDRLPALRIAILVRYLGDLSKLSSRLGVVPGAIMGDDAKPRQTETKMTENHVYHEIIL